MISVLPASRLLAAGTPYLKIFPAHSTDGLTKAEAAGIFNPMVDNRAALDTLFHALGDSTRRHMLRNLASGEQTVSELARPFAISLAAASKHIKTLENAGLIRREVIGRTHLCRIEAEPLAAVSEWLSYYERFWNRRLDDLEQALRREDAPETHGNTGDV
jgi:DNA-binding transcriptional ArsR family regulator